MKKLKYLVIHCTDTPEGMKVTKEMLHQWHIEERGWSRLGYADMIHANGTIENLTPYNDDEFVDPWEVTNGAFGFNGNGRHVVYVGGGSGIDTRTFEQVEALEKYVKQTIENYPNIKVIGHNQVSQKYCPSFDVPTWLRGICVDSKNIRE